MFFGVFIKTGVDASPEGISLLILEKLGPQMIGFPTQTVLGISSIILSVALLVQMRDDLEFAAAFIVAAGLVVFG